MSDIPQPPPQNMAAPFTDMARRVSANSTEPFGGAFVVVLPDGSEFAGLLLDAAANPAMLLSMLKTRMDMALNEIADRERQQLPGGFGGRR